MAFVRGGRELVAGGDPAGLHLWDLQFYDRHIAGNAHYWISRLKAEGVEDVDWDAVEHWRATLAMR